MGSGPDKVLLCSRPGGPGQHAALPRLCRRWPPLESDSATAGEESGGGLLVGSLGSHVALSTMDCGLRFMASCRGAPSPELMEWFNA